MTLIKCVSDTAFGIAHFRALESERTDALFHDPLAGLLAGEHGRQIAAVMPVQFLTGQIAVIRTCIIDEYIRLAVSQDVDVILNLGAGLDTRPYRMNLPESLLWIEADYPPVIEFKKERLSNEKPRCCLERLKLDLANLPERRQALASIDARARKMLVLTEGVISYLTVEEVGSLADELKTLNHACYWIVEYLSPQAIKYRRRRSVGRGIQNAPFKFTPKDWIGFFGEHGWRPKEVRYLSEEAERLHRPIQLPLFLRVRIRIQTLFASAEKRAGFKRFQGYLMLEPEPAAFACGTPTQKQSS